MDISNPPVHGMEIRSKILALSLTIEGLSSAYLSMLLEIKNLESSYSFGNTGNALSFNHKIHLLIDLAAIDREKKKLIITFAEIRNQFMHNPSATSYETCFSYMSGKEKFILSAYPQAQSSKEEQLKQATNDLAADVIKTLAGVTEAIKKRIVRDVESEMYPLLRSSVTIALENALADVRKTIDQITYETEYVKSEVVKKLSETFTQTFDVAFRSALRNMPNT